MPRLPDLTPEELKKVQKLKGIDSSSEIEVSPEMYFMAEFGKFFGWEGIVALETGVISISRAIDLVAASKKVWYTYLYQEALANYYSSKDAKTFNSGMKSFINKTKVAE